MTSILGLLEMLEIVEQDFSEDNLSMVSAVMDFSCKFFNFYFYLGGFLQRVHI